MEVKKYQPGDETKIIQLFNLCFNQEMSLEAWNWRFLNNPFTKEIFVHLMWEGEDLVGHYAVSPVNMLANGEELKTALSMTTMTHPDYGGRGIFTQLAKSVYRELEKENYGMVWGFPNVNSHYGFLKNLNWQDIAIIPMLSASIENIRTNISPVDFILHQEFTPKVAQLIEENADLKKLKINKTKDYLNWRYRDNPTNNYKILSLRAENAVIVYKTIKSFSNKEAFEIDIMEVNFQKDYEVLQKLIITVIKAEENLNIQRLNIWQPLFSSTRLFFEKIGFQPALPLTYLSYSNLQLNGGNTTDYQQWEIGLGYSDVF